MNKRWILAIIISLFVVTLTVYQVIVTTKNARKIGYCFDAALDLSENRLFITAGQAGLHIFDFIGGQINYVATYYDAGYYRNIEIRDDRAFIADTKRGLVILDITGDTPETMWVQGEVGLGLYIEDNTLFLAAGTRGLYIFNISDVGNPQLLSHIENIDEPWDVWVHQGLVYVADVHKGLVIIDATTPARPRQIGFITWDEKDPMAEVIRGEGDYVYIASGIHGLIVLDVSNPADPVVASKYDPGPESFGEGAYVRDHIVYLAIGDKVHDDENGLHILDASDPYSLTLLGKLPVNDWVENIYATNSYVFMTNTWSGVRSIDVRNVFNPVQIDHFESLP
jgi:hypothetical protein